MAKKKAKKAPEISSGDGNKYAPKAAKNSFTRNLLQWNDQQNTRQMPWKGEPDPYKIWLSEIILQQTRVEQGWAYYLRFTEKYPTLPQLAQAPDTEVFKLWEGLGYYSRCRNLLAAARNVMAHNNGEFPQDYAGILALKGVGPYTAAAIASFAFGLPYAVVDGNVIRVLARYFGVSTPFDSAAGKKLFAALAQELLEKKRPGIYNQAIMDFGAVVCKPISPDCSQCPLQKDCYAFRHQKTNSLPVKEKAIARKTRWFTYLLITGPRGKLVRQRVEKDIWQHLHEFVLVESKEAMEWGSRDLKHWILEKHNIPVTGLTKSSLLTQQLTHQTVNVQFISAKTRTQADISGFAWVPDKELAHLAFPRIIRQYLDDPEARQSRMF
jgi:A/G-specific adenine glycosylase